MFIAEFALFLLAMLVGRVVSRVVLANCRYTSVPGYFGIDVASGE